ncbi:hypothetical protein P8C59_002842 [Phyllachora maydis]|uniref:Glycoside hydrolase subgroup catalytic core protein n=1 Tax=Phyllachora maydis TaxID=1825666 RepID=A0AAD9I079_9PEZI|nr:hypothetical protein P8C59_002842 [Phyllachora maydis]
MQQSLLRLLLLGAVVARRASGQDQTGFHPDWPRWCGKVYESGYPSFNPGGQMSEPPVAPNAPLLNVQFQPRYSLYLSDETEGQFVVNAELSPYFGQQPWSNKTAATATTLSCSINVASTNLVLVERNLTVGTTGNLFSFDLGRLTPSLDPIDVVLYGAPSAGDGPSFAVNASLLFLPTKTNNGSATRLDKLHGGMQFRDARPGHAFAPLLPYGFYASNDGFLKAADASAQIAQYAALGLNAMVPLAFKPDNAGPFAQFDQLGLKYMYDLRDQYQNASWVTEQVLAARDGPALFAYWSADEPDGHQDPFNAPVQARDLIRRLDPYHPVALVLNCQDYYFAEYSAGADIIMEDVYPIGINSTFSKWGTACNTTLGDCGCDNCQGNVQDVSRRLDDLARYERWLNRWPKTKIHNPQSFFGEGYWSRYPTVDEAYTMSILALNHGAQAIISWVWPTTSALAAAHGALARAVSAGPVAAFLAGGDAGARPRPLAVNTPNSATALVDAAAWVAAGGRQALVAVANAGYADVQGPVRVSVPNASAVAAAPWGQVPWALDGDVLSVGLLPALGTSMVILDLRASG